MLVFVKVIKAQSLYDDDDDDISLVPTAVCKIRQSIKLSMNRFSQGKV